MISANQDQRLCTGRHMNIYILVFGWTFFLSLGIYTGGRFNLISKEILLATVSSKIAFDFMVISRCVVILFSLVITQCFVHRWLIIPVCIRAICYGYLLGVSYAIWGNAAWLFNMLYFLPNTLLILGDLWFWVALIR